MSAQGGRKLQTVLYWFTALGAPEVRNFVDYFVFFVCSNIALQLLQMLMACAVIVVKLLSNAENVATSTTTDSMHFFASNAVTVRVVVSRSS